MPPPSSLFLIRKSDRGAIKQDLHLVLSSFFLSEKISLPRKGRWNILRTLDSQMRIPTSNEVSNIRGFADIEYPNILFIRNRMGL